MGYHLQNLRTGEDHPLDPARTLIGSADHADIQPRGGGPYLAALVTGYDDGWVVRGLADDPDVTFNRVPLKVGERAFPQPFDVIGVGDDYFRFVVADGADVQFPPDADPTPPTCLAYVRSPDGMEECLAVDHDLLVGRLAVCHVRFPDARLSRLAALLAAHAGGWFVHTLKGAIGRNGHRVTGYARVEHGDRLQIGPLVVRVEITDAIPETTKHAARFDPGSVVGGPTPTDSPEGTLETELPLAAEPPPDRTPLRKAALKLDHWLKDQEPAGSAHASGLAGWFGAQKEKLTRFWLDTPEATQARGLRTAGKLDEAFAGLDRAIRARPDSPELLRELYRLYEAAGLADLCYRPLRQIEKLATAKGGTDPWVLETMARVCERLGRDRPAMFDRAVNYWIKLEKVTGVSYAPERDAAMARRTLREGGYTKADDGA